MAPEDLPGSHLKEVHISLQHGIDRKNAPLITFPEKFSLQFGYIIGRELVVFDYSANDSHSSTIHLLK